MPANTNTEVRLRAPRPEDTACLIAGRDVESKRYLGEGAADPRPTFCIVVDGEVVGWVDFDTERDWLQPGEVNIGYNVFPTHRGRGYATRAVRLLFDHLATDTQYAVATLLIDLRNERSMRVAERLGCTRQPDFDGNAYYKISMTPTNSGSTTEGERGDRAEAPHLHNECGQRVSALCGEGRAKEARED